MAVIVLYECLLKSKSSGRVVVVVSKANKQTMASRGMR